MGRSVFDERWTSFGSFDLSRAAQNKRPLSTDFCGEGTFGNPCILAAAYLPICRSAHLPICLPADPPACP